jgi:hypothetical protein
MPPALLFRLFGLSGTRPGARLNEAVLKSLSKLDFKNYSKMVYADRPVKAAEGLKPGDKAPLFHKVFQPSQNAFLSVK